MGKTTSFENSALAPMVISAPGKLTGIKLNQLVEYVDFIQHWLNWLD
jgi:hypothetical protein